MPIAQMNCGRMKFGLDDQRGIEFADSLDRIHVQAEQSPGFIWRIDGDDLAAELKALGFEHLMSTTVSVWHSEADLIDYTYNSEHGVFLKRASEWFEKVEGPQLVIWDVSENNRPSFADAWHRLKYLERFGESVLARDLSTQ